jgi:hypothetical protein
VYEAVLLEQRNDRVDIVSAARRSGLDRATGGVDAQALGIKDRRRHEFR